MLQAVKLPAGIAHLNTGLANMDGDTFTLERNRKKINEFLILKLNHIFVF